MRKLAIAVTVAAGLAVIPIQAQAYDDIGPPLVDGLVAGAIIGADPYGYYGPGYVVTGRYGRVFHGPFYDHTRGRGAAPDRPWRTADASGELLLPGAGFLWSALVGRLALVSAARRSQ